LVEIRGRVDDVADIQILLKQRARDGGADFNPGPARIERYAGFRAYETLRLIPDRRDLRLGEAPGVEGALRLGHRDDARLQAAAGFAEPPFRDRTLLSQLLEVFQRLAIEMLLRQGVHQLALLLPQFLAPDNGK